MKKLIAFVLTWVCVLALAGCGKNDTYKVGITVPAGSTEAFVYSDEEILATGKKIIINCGYIGKCPCFQEVNAEIEKHFSVKVDDTDSQYTHPEQSDCYLLVPSAMGGLSVSMSNYSVNGNRTTAIYAVYNSIDKRILKKVELCIENEDSEEDFRIVYARKV